MITCMKAQPCATLTSIRRVSRMVIAGKAHNFTQRGNTIVMNRDILISKERAKLAPEKGNTGGIRL